MNQNATIENDCPELRIGISGPASVFPPISMSDDGRVQLGGQPPMCLSEMIADDGQVRLGGQAPMFLPEIIADAGLVRLGGQSPTF